MEVTINLQRFDPETDAPIAKYQEYTIEISEVSTVLDAIIKIHEEIDGTVAMRYSCRSSICGSCAMKINGSAALGCKTRLVEVSEDGGTITVEPVGNLPVVKDLVADFTPFWNKIKSVDPYLKPSGPEPEFERIASNESMTSLLTAQNCIMCGCCVSDCTVLEVDSTFAGPAALAKAWRFTEDPRDAATNERLKILNDTNGGMWDCTRCMKCVEVCPKEVAPMDRIMEIREAAIQAGNTNTPGYRHTESMYNSVKKNGRLDETRLAIDSAGWTNLPRLLDLAPIGIAAMRKGKLPPIRPHKADDNKKIKDIYDNVENEAD
ncbi:succinate dehydrogenase/fumarate reductase iron-sulfur subunit [Candidatus Lucifugimonas marina]|uniref:Fumarate reductase iron-sulfur subunit n=1 Tax=Candidatus Lucifugimonas marina TaxID=3038979 RepID=A0AAJ5ZGA1_9CHLR|nr:succinate dehydrogenase iron-sulfur subunit [SAR202 cluster bacterium JH702]MDG0868916.1 succinate dehydrogenase iron-sulfur subunit [SAR202 cluster bacterium JH639]WFG35544.1 succinate dehydrogenase iron-sulfur subunit [SAR202 cluster bacterium JH545]WFG39491.1 succinate dehydrogenase iron-sulfur subunit [SAR202 cluster bacterium JH1073]